MLEGADIDWLPETEQTTATYPALRPGKQARQIRTRLKTLDDRITRLQRKLSETEEQLGDPKIYEDRDNPDLQRLLRGMRLSPGGSP